MIPLRGIKFYTLVFFLLKYGVSLCWNNNRYITERKPVRGGVLKWSYEGNRGVSDFMLVIGWVVKLSRSLKPVYIYYKQTINIDGK